jgi:hypothetical protein
MWRTDTSSNDAVFSSTIVVPEINEYYICLIELINVTFV